jgi:hypothetical protein
MREFSPRAVTYFSSPRPPPICDQFSDTVFQFFIDVIHSQSASLNTTDLPAVRQLVSEWQCPRVFTEFESKLLAAQNPEKIISFYAAAPDLFPALGDAIRDHIDDYSRDFDNFWTIPVTSLIPLIQTNPVPVFPSTFRERFAALRRVRQQSSHGNDESTIETLRAEVGELRAQVERLDSEIAAAEDEDRRLTRDSEAAADKVEERLDSLDSLLRELKAEYDFVAATRQETEEFRGKAGECRKWKEDLERETGRLKTGEI